MKEELPGLLTRPNEPAARWENGKVSEMMIDFAAPLLTMEPGCPRDVQTLRYIMMLATICWHAPAREAAGDPLCMRMLDQLPMSLQRPMRKMIEDRKTRFASVAFQVVVDVSGTNFDNARIVARAFAPKRS